MMTQDKPATPPAKPVVIGLTTAAQRYGIAYMTLIEWVRRGKLTELWEGRQRVALVSEVEAAVAERLSGKPQASEVLGEYIREDQRDPQ